MCEGFWWQRIEDRSGQRWMLKCRFERLALRLQRGILGVWTTTARSLNRLTRRGPRATGRTVISSVETAASLDFRANQMHYLRDIVGPTNPAGEPPRVLLAQGRLLDLS